MDEKKILIDNLEVNYKTEGEGKPLLILHGWTIGASDRWIEIQDSLSKFGYKVICLDLPGFGKSQAPKFAWTPADYSNFIEKFISFLRLDKFYLLGHSFGGALAVRLSLKLPHKIERLFLVDAACFRRKYLRKTLFFFVAKILKIFSFLPGYPNLKKFFYKVIVRKTDYLDAEGIMREIYLKAISDDLDMLDKITVPTIIVWGEKDTITPLKQGRLINKIIENSQLDIIPGAVHSPYKDKAVQDKFVQIILNYLE